MEPRNRPNVCDLFTLPTLRSKCLFYLLLLYTSEIWVPGQSWFCRDSSHDLRLRPVGSSGSRAIARFRGTVKSSGSSRRRAIARFHGSVRSSRSSRRGSVALSRGYRWEKWSHPNLLKCHDPWRASWPSGRELEPPLRRADKLLVSVRASQSDHVFSCACEGPKPTERLTADHRTVATRDGSSRGEASWVCLLPFSLGAELTFLSVDIFAVGLGSNLAPVSVLHTRRAQKPRDAL